MVREPTPWRDNEGSCQRCSERRVITDKAGVIFEHNRCMSSITARSSPVTLLWRLCPGSGKPCAEEQRYREFRARAGKIKRISVSRGEASVVLDAYLSGHDGFAADVARLVKLALLEYRMTFTARPKYTWSVVDRDQSGWHEVRRSDVYCTFCRELLESNVLGPASSNMNVEMVERHTTACALQCLAGQREMADPSERNLPHELRADP